MSTEHTRIGDTDQGWTMLLGEFRQKMRHVETQLDAMTRDMHAMRLLMSDMAAAQTRELHQLSERVTKLESAFEAMKSSDGARKARIFEVTKTAITWMLGIVTLGLVAIVSATFGRK